MEKQESVIDPAKVKGEIKQILEEFNKAERLDSLEKKGMVKVLQKIEVVFREIIGDDPSTEEHYGKLADEIHEKVNDLMNSPKLSPYATGAAASSSKDDFSWNQVREREDQGAFDFESALKVLDYKELRCLSFCFSFFCSFSTPVEVNKRELIHWLIGMDLIDEPLEGQQVLAKLVAEEVLCPVTNGETAQSSRLTIHPSVLANPSRRRLDPYEGMQIDRLFISSILGPLRRISLQTVDRLAAINTSAYTLNAKIFDRLFKMKKAKVVHLGSWHPDMDYVVVEDIIIKVLNELKNLKEIRFLSLQGISRLQVLPNSIYSLSKLKILDLRACQDLADLPKGIESLQQLTHLDLSQCYELHNIPKGITSLVNLTVLKGFVVDPDSDHSHTRFRKYKKRLAANCQFSELSKLGKLAKLTVRTRMANFPATHDLEGLCEMQELKKLRITWVCGTTTSQEADPSKVYTLRRFPLALQKLDLRATPEAIASRLLGLIGNRSHNQLKKLYIRGGGLWKLDLQKYCFPNVEVVRLRFLPKLHMNWYEFKPCFPKLTRLEIFRCPHLIFFPCDVNGIWEEQ